MIRENFISFWLIAEVFWAPTWRTSLGNPFGWSFIIWALDQSSKGRLVLELPFKTNFECIVDKKERSRKKLLLANRWNQFHFNEFFTFWFSSADFSVFNVPIELGFHRIAATGWNMNIVKCYPPAGRENLITENWKKINILIKENLIRVY